MTVYEVAVAAIIEKNTGVVVTPQPATGGLEAQQLFSKGESQMYATSCYDVLHGYLGDKPDYCLPATDRIRWFAGGYGSAAHFLVRADSDIKTFADLKGKKCMFDRPGMAIWWQVFPNVLKAYGLSTDDIVIMPALGYRESMQALKEGTADATLQYSAVPGPAFKEAALTRPLRVLPIEPDKQAEILKAIPFEHIEIIPGGTYEGTPDDTPALFVWCPLIMDKTLPDDFAYESIKAVIDNFEELQAAHALFKTWKPIDLAADPAVPYHAGVLKYYKEAGMMKPEWEKKHNDMLKLMKQEK